MSDPLRRHRGRLLGSWRWPLGAVLSLVVAVYSALDGSWLTAAIFVVVALGLAALTVALRRRRA